MTTFQKRPLAYIESLAIKLTYHIGTPLSVALHTLVFVAIFSLYFIGVEMEHILLVLTTAVSLEAIYLSIFIQMSINRTTESLEVVHENVDEIAKDVDEIQEDVEDLEGNVVEISKDIDVIQENVEGIGDEVEEISKDIDEIQGTDEKADPTLAMLKTVDAELRKISREVEILRSLRLAETKNSLSAK